MKKYLIPLTALLLTACAAQQPGPDTSGDYELRSATPGIVDHNVIPKK